MLFRSQNYELNYNDLALSYAKTNLYKNLLDVGTTGSEPHVSTAQTPFGEEGSMNKWVTMVAEQDPEFFVKAMEHSMKKSKGLYDRLKGQYVKVGNRTITVEDLVMEIQTQNL